ncbi:50S ribosomal protein L13 [Hymenobacter sp. M29]|uniref:Large ribosomal subunit protein uL13 n=1 Tax=Hymenobacter mellowenesis TaxID=3063995 RepID=A0ABT9A6A2_9BACT|nr:MULTISPECIES: 50S ribosomal protein L13 [unclassified Hymenobacter]MDO7845368.1 50S ribosomal protein L13 [Hymenobacter sp. M29]MDO7850111.1 50S ribosomal protein L13 [Hymenobacter sp. CA1UV-4]
MDHLSFKTTHVNKANAQKSWVIVDASVAPLGRVASQIANILRGKHKPSFTPNADCGDNVIVINADNLRVTGKKMTEKVYITHSGYPGGQKRRTVREQMERDSRRVIEHAVKGMLQGNRLGAAQYRNLYVYAGDQHPHEAQQPVAIELKNL